MKAKKATPRKPRVWKGWITLYPAGHDGPDLYEGQQGESRGLRALPTVSYTSEEALKHTDGTAQAIRVELREILK